MHKKVKTKKKRVSFLISEKLENDITRIGESTYDVVTNKRESYAGQVFKMAFSVFRTDVRYFSPELRSNLILYANKCCSGNIESAINMLLERDKKKETPD